MQIESHFASQHRDSGALYSDFLLIVAATLVFWFHSQIRKAVFRSKIPLLRQHQTADWHIYRVLGEHSGTFGSKRQIFNSGQKHGSMYER